VVRWEDLGAPTTAQAREFWMRWRRFSRWDEQNPEEHQVGHSKVSYSSQA